MKMHMFSRDTEEDRTAERAIAIGAVRLYVLTKHLPRGFARAVLSGHEVYTPGALSVLQGGLQYKNLARVLPPPAATAADRAAKLRGSLQSALSKAGHDLENASFRAGPGQGGSARPGRWPDPPRDGPGHRDARDSDSDMVDSARTGSDAGPVTERGSEGARGRGYEGRGG